MGKVKKAGSGRGQRGSGGGVNKKKTKTKLVGRGGNGGARRQQQRVMKKNKKRVKKTWRSVREKKNKQGSCMDGDGSSVTAGNLDNTSQNEESKASTTTSSGKTDKSLRARMLDRLSIARFRTLNATMYKAKAGGGGGATDSDEEDEHYDRNNPLSNFETFESYHSGFERASSSWKTNPVDLIAKWIKEHVPAEHIVADFGCGRAALARSIPHKTHSLDLHALDDSVIECDMRRTPLADASVNVVVFCLSLMGTDVTDCLSEAWRVLKFDGVVKIAEVGSRLFAPSSGKNDSRGNNKKQNQPGQLKSFLNGMRQIGFKMIGGVENIGGSIVSRKNTPAIPLFVIMQFRKVVKNLGSDSGSQGETQHKKSFRNKPVRIQLGPCVYKKR